tara:strand:+ start:468 stop:758 length:291 start_codon:yes stop_codon:yes gene_type:complete
MKDSSDLMMRSDSALVVVDFQSRLAPAMSDLAAVSININALVKAATQFSIPLILTEHCPDKIGLTVASIREQCQPENILPKTAFDALAELSIVRQM